MKYRLITFLSILLFSLVTANANINLNGVSTAFPDEGNRNELRVFPNPAQTKQITIDFQSTEISEIRLINIAGKELIAKTVDFGTTKYTLQLDEIPNGIYFLRVKTSENRIVVKKLVVSVR